MGDINLTNMSRDELLTLQDKVAKEIREYEMRRKREALAAAKAKAREMGFSLEDLMGPARSQPKRTAYPPKYRHPENPDLTWSGRGRHPKWIREGLANGTELDDYLVSSESARQRISGT